MRRTRLAACGVLAVVLWSTGAGAQTSLQIPLQFDLINPGAKSLAMGGAFAGLADDATAVFANPAGLRELGRTEVSVEARGRWLSSPFLQRGRLSVGVQNEGTDTIAGPVFGESADNSFRVPFVSVVVPRPQRGWAVAAFRHELSRVNQLSFAEGVFQQDPTEITSRREFPQEGVRKIALTSYGAAGAFELNPRIAVGATISLHTFKLMSDFRRFDVVGFLGPPNRNVQLGRSTQDGKDTAVTPTLGIRACLKRCDDRQTTSARFGFVYRQGATFTYDTQSGPNFRVNRFRVPNVFAGGAAVEVPRPGRRLLLTGEVKRTTYSRLKQDFIDDQAVDFEVEDNVRLNDGTEVRAGVQYTIETAAWLPRFRAGIWSDPDHTVKYLPAAGDHPELRLKDELLSIALSTGRRETHYSAGLGLTFSPTVEWNFGADFADSTTIVSASVILKLGR
jgi:hypothetical protein